jgi:hypothetical protein
MMSIDASTDQVAQAVYGCAAEDLTGQQRRELVRRLRWDGLHAEADAVWTRVLRDSISELAVNGAR